ncbi:MAG: hypothetical protein K6A74_09285 [Lachnospiraceae bacterium]|nr:hypothetical protein [Lachnospiraceae bacterium]
MEYLKEIDVALKRFGTKLGNAFLKAMTQEIPDWLSNPETTDLKSFYASLSYLYIQGLIEDSETIRETVGMLMDDGISEKGLGDIVAGISRIVFEELLGKNDYSDIRELTTFLNSITIPEWVFDWGKDLVVKICEGLFEYEGSLFYLTKDKKFIRLIISEIDDEGTLDDPLSDYEEIGEGYEKIYGFNDNLKRVYLKAERQDEFYQCYDINTHTFAVNRGELIAIVKGTPYIRKDGYIAFVKNGEIHNIKELKEDERVLFEKECFHIVPESKNDRFFCPYCVKPDGTVISEEDDYIKDCIWNIINAPRFGWKITPGHILNVIERPEQMTINSILKTYESIFKKMGEDRRKKYVILEEILNCFATYIGRDEDITRLLYSLYKCNRTYSRFDFPTEKLYWRVRDLTGDDGEYDILQSIIKDQKYDELEKILMGDKAKTTGGEQFEDGLIGTFEVTNDQLQVETMNRKDGVVMGSLILPSIESVFNKGIVYYDTARNQYDISCNSALSEVMRKNIVEIFNLEDCCYAFWVTPKSNVECGRSMKKVVIDEEKFVKEAIDGDEDF